MIDFNNPTHRERTAIHEAGHAVVATFSSLHPRVKSLVLSDSLGGGGHCHMEDSGGAMADPGADLLTQGIAACAAGLLAEKVAFESLARVLEFDDASRDEAAALELAQALRIQFLLEGLRADRARHLE